MKIVDYNIFNGQKNMDIDSEILEESIRLRLFLDFMVGVLHVFH